MQPGGELCGARAIGVSLRPDPQEGLLHEVLGGGAVAAAELQHVGHQPLQAPLLLQTTFDGVTYSQMIAQANFRGYTTTEVPIPTRYFAEASSVSFDSGVAPPITLQ